MIFSFFGLCVGFFALALGKANRLVLMACLATELVFGWFVFVVYVLAMPSFAAARMPAMSDLSPDASRALVLMVRKTAERQAPFSSSSQLMSLRHMKVHT